MKVRSCIIPTRGEYLIHDLTRLQRLDLFSLLFFSLANVYLDAFNCEIYEIHMHNEI